MKINRAQAQAAFAAYVQNYNSKDDKTRLKIEHTNRVSRLCERIARDIGLSAEETDLAWLLGLLHDVGRFEQLRQFGTFDDSVSIDHAAYGADILFGEGRIRDYAAQDTQDALLETAIRMHNAYRVTQGLDSRTEMFCHILRDADKIDILRVNVEFPLEEIYNVPTDRLQQEDITPEVAKSFYEKHAILRSLKKTTPDLVIGHISLVFELVYPISAAIVKEQGYLEQMLAFTSRNPRTQRQFREMREFMHNYLAQRTQTTG